MAGNLSEFEVGRTYEDRSQPFTVVAIDSTAGTIDVRFRDGTESRGQDAAIKWRIWQNVQADRAKEQRQAAEEARRNAPLLVVREDHGLPQAKRYTPEYLARISASLHRFLKNGDDVVCVGYYLHHYGECELCSHAPIKWHYVLANLRGDQMLTVGSECVENYTMMLSQWGYKPDYIVFPHFLRRFTSWIQCQGGVAYGDGPVMRFKGDARRGIPAGAEAFRVLVGDGASGVVVDERGRRNQMTAFYDPMDDLPW